jgi:hypothetical protein
LVSLEGLFLFGAGFWVRLTGDALLRKANSILMRAFLFHFSSLLLFFLLE